MREGKRGLLQYFPNALWGLSQTSHLPPKIMKYEFPFLEGYFTQEFISSKRNGLIHLNSHTEYAVECECSDLQIFLYVLVYEKVMCQRKASSVSFFILCNSKVLLSYVSMPSTLD